MNTFGQHFRLSIFGESHGAAVGIIIDGCPAGIALSPADFTADLQRRAAGAPGTTARHEPDVPQLMSGIYNGCTTGAPIAIRFANHAVQAADYEQFRTLPRPAHADFAATKKWNNYNDLRGGGHLSGRLTVALVAAGVIAKKIIAPIAVTATLCEAGGSTDIAQAVAAAAADGDSVGGLIACTAKNIPAGWGEPFFNSVESLLSHLIFAIPGIKGIAFGSGFDAAVLRGSAHNDLLLSTTGATATNHAGGLTGGLTNGNDLFFRVAVKPTPSIAQTQHTANIATGEITPLRIRGRHDTCFALRVPVIIEAATAIVLADFLS